MSFKAPKCDEDIKEIFRRQSMVVDTIPCKSQHEAFVMRPRDRSKEHGPEFRFKPRVTMQRVNNELQKRRANEFKPG